MDYTIPKCAVCGGPVESFEVEEMPLVRAQKLTARCHGAVQEVVITHDERRDFTITITDAFAPATPRGARRTPARSP